MIMTYQETLDFLYTQLPVYQKIGVEALNKKLDKTLAFCSYLGDPQNQFKSIHVAGTNGKGSVSHMLSAVLDRGGFKVGLYTSPHLKSFTERIKINGIELEEKFVVSFVQHHKLKIIELTPSFFEITVVMAFEYFAQQNVDYAVIEVGLGGRFDSTNIIIPVLSIITNISLDHTAILGESIAAISREKAGIIKASIPVIIGEYHEDSYAVFKDVSSRFHSQLVNAFDGLVGDEDYEEKNLNTVRCSLKYLDLGIDEKIVGDPLVNYKIYSGFKGRWQTLSLDPKVICDTGHNVAGVTEVVKKLAKESYKQLFIIWGMVIDKNHSEVLKLLPKSARYVFCEADIDRSIDSYRLCELALVEGLHGNVIKDVNEALSSVKKEAADADLILIGGSTFVIAELIDL